MDDLPEIDAIVGTGAWNRLPEAILAVLEGKRVTFVEGSSILPEAGMRGFFRHPDTGHM